MIENAPEAFLLGLGVWLLGFDYSNGDRSGVLLVCFVCCWLGGVRKAEQV